MVGERQPKKRNGVIGEKTSTFRANLSAGINGKRKRGGSGKINVTRAMIARMKETRDAVRTLATSHIQPNNYRFHIKQSHPLAGKRCMTKTCQFQISDYTTVLEQTLVCQDRMDLMDQLKKEKTQQSVEQKQQHERECATCYFSENNYMANNCKVDEHNDTYLGFLKRYWEGLENIPCENERDMEILTVHADQVYPLPIRIGIRNEKILVVCGTCCFCKLPFPDVHRLHVPPLPDEMLIGGYKTLNDSNNLPWPVLLSTPADKLVWMHKKCADVL